MDEDYISKKEVLEQYHISYGALYRWKRMGLIPEDWFIRKATATGQETFFRRKQICDRVEMILARKERVSLEELAEELKGRRQQQRSARRLHLETKFERRDYSVGDLLTVSLTDGEHTIDILDYFKEVSL